MKYAFVLQYQCLGPFLFMQFVLFMWVVMNIHTVQAVTHRWITWYKLQHNMCQVSHIPANTVDGTFNFMCYVSALSERTLTI